MRRGLAFFMAALCLLLAGCGQRAFLPYAREVENMALMRTLGVDAEKSGVLVTAASGVQSKGAEKGDEPPLMLSQTAGTVSGACLAMQSQGTADIFLGHVGQLLLGQELAELGVSAVLDYVERDIEMRLDTDLYVVKNGSASEAIRACAGPSSAPADRLEALADDAGLMAMSMPRSVKDVLSGLARDGAAFVPAVELVPRREGDGGTGEEYDLREAGYAVLKGGVLRGWAEGDAALGVNLLLGQVEADVLEFFRPEGNLALRVVGAKSEVTPIFEEDTLAGLKIVCTVEANVAQAPPGLVLSQSVLEDLCDALAGAERGRLERTLELSQSLNADFLGLCRAAGMTTPWRWAALCSQWDAAFATLPVQVEVRANIQRSYDVK